MTWSPKIAQVGEVGDRLVDVEVLRIVDGGFGAERVLLFEVLLHVRGLVLDVQTGLDAVGDDARAIAERGRRRRARDAERKEEADAIGATEVEILADDGFEEVPALDRAVEDLREADLELADGEPMLVAGGAIARASAATAAAATSDRRRPARRRARAHRRSLAGRRDRHTRGSHCRDSSKRTRWRRSCCFTHSWPLRQSLMG